MKIFEAEVTHEKMITVLPDDTCYFHANKLLDLFKLIPIIKQEIAQETEHRRFLLSLFWEVVDEFNNLFDKRVEVVIDEQLTILKNLCDEFPSVDTVFHVIHK